MERRKDIELASKIMGPNFIGPEQLDSVAGILGIKSPYKMGQSIPEINFEINILEKSSEKSILILGSPFAYDDELFTINKIRSIYGTDPSKKEPCLYNQDWYLKEDFASKRILNFKWYLIEKDIEDSYRGKAPLENCNIFPKNQKYPSAILACYTFFSTYILKNKILWENDFIWCEDLDHNGDQVYVGKYNDPDRVNKSGFNVHRYLRINKSYCSVMETVSKEE